MKNLKKIVLGLICFLPLNLFAQNVELIERKLPNTNITEVFYAYSADTSIKHGAYYKLGYYHSKQRNDTLIKGFFKNNRKDSIWKNYYYDNILHSTGSYLEDKEFGIWEYYSSDGKIDQRYNFTTKEVLYSSDIDKNKEFIVILKHDTIKTKLDRPLLPIGGSSGMLQYIHKNVRYPHLAVRNSIEGKVTVSFFVDSLGNASDYKIVEGIGFGCDEEALRVIKLIQDRWIPGILNGEKVSVENTITVNYKMR